MVELGWTPHHLGEEALRICEEINLKLLFQDFSKIGGMQENYLDRPVSEEDVKAFVEHAKPYKCVEGYYVWDEPYVPDQLYEARRQTDFCRKYDEDRLAFTVAIPSYNMKYRWENGLFAYYLENYVTTINPEVLSLDYYPIGLPGYNENDKLNNSLMWCDLGCMRALADKYKLPLWFYYQGLAMHGYENFTEEMIRVSMYAAVLYGAKGLQQYNNSGSVIDGKGDRYKFFDYMKAIHKEFEHLGNILMALHSKYIFHSDDLLPGCKYHEGLYNDIKESEVLYTTLPANTSVGELADDYGHEYLAVLNRDYTKEADISLALKKNYHIFLLDRADGREKYLGIKNTLDLSLGKGDALIYRLADAKEEAYTLEYRIEK